MLSAAWPSARGPSAAGGFGDFGLILRLLYKGVVRVL